MPSFDRIDTKRLFFFKIYFRHILKIDFIFMFVTEAMNMIAYLLLYQNYRTIIMVTFVHNCNMKCRNIKQSLVDVGFEIMTPAYQRRFSCRHPHITTSVANRLHGQRSGAFAWRPLLRPFHEDRPIPTRPYPELRTWLAV